MLKEKFFEFEATGTDEQKVDAIAKAFYRFTIDHICGGNVVTEVDDRTREFVAHVYGLYSVPVPEIVIMSVNDAHDYTERSLSDGVGVSRLHQLVHDFAGQKILGEEIDKELLLELEFCEKFWTGFFCHEACVLVPYPKTVKLDSNDQFHADGGPALVWEINGKTEGRHYHHGAPYPTWVRVDPTKEKLEAETDAERRRLFQTLIGHERVIQLLGLEPKESATLGGLQYQLYVSKEGGESWLRMQSPELLDGTQPWYTEPVHERVTSCAEALGWRATGRLGVTVRYGHEA